MAPAIERPLLVISSTHPLIWCLSRPVLDGAFVKQTILFQHLVLLDAHTSLNFDPFPSHQTALDWARMRAACAAMPSAVTGVSPASPTTACWPVSAIPARTDTAPATAVTAPTGRLSGRLEKKRLTLSSSSSVTPMSLRLSCGLAIARRKVLATCSADSVDRFMFSKGKGEGGSRRGM